MFTKIDVKAIHVSQRGNLECQLCLLLLLSANEIATDSQTCHSVHPLLKSLNRFQLMGSFMKEHMFILVGNFCCKLQQLIFVLNMFYHPVKCIQN